MSAVPPTPAPTRKLDNPFLRIGVDSTPALRHSQKSGEEGEEKVE